MSPNYLSSCAIIGEIKLVSPSYGVLDVEKNIESRAVCYERLGLDAISVITEKTRFRGDPSYVSRVKKVSHLPILQKDFVTRESQIYESKALGADALLLIANIVSLRTLCHFVSLCLKLQIEPVVEIYDERDLEMALASQATHIAANARNLQTLEVDIHHSCRLLSLVPDRYIKLGFSGIHTKTDIDRYVSAGAKGVLIGTSLITSKNADSFIKNLRATPSS